MCPLCHLGNMKRSKLKTAHTPVSQKGSGDFYGSAIRNPISKPISVMGMNIKPKKVKKSKSY